MFAQGDKLGDGAIVKSVDHRARFMIIEKQGTTICLGLKRVSRGQCFMKLPLYWETDRR